MLSAYTIIQSLRTKISQGIFASGGNTNTKIMPKRKVIPSGVLNSYRSLVAMMAWKAWRKLPIQTRIWIGIEDMIEDGMMQVVQLVTYAYNPKWAGLSTAIYHRLHKFYINEYLEFHSAQKRGWTKISKFDNVSETEKRFGNKRSIAHQSIEALTQQMRDKITYQEDWNVPGSVLLPGSLVVHERSIVDNAIAECFVVPALSKVYKEASPKLQDAMLQWFLSQDVTRVHKHGKRFRKASKEFRCLCKEQDITCDDCLHLVRSASCLDSLSRKVLGIPYSLDFPTPRVDRVV